MNKKMIILLVVVVLSVILSACSTDSGSISDSILSVPMGSSEIEQLIDSAIESSCPQNPDGTCKLMGQK